jgi:GTPase involved in cell partitioning and DNA repair
VQVRREIEAYGQGLETKLEVLVLNKADLMSSGDVERKRRALAEVSGVNAMMMSGEQGEGVTEVLRELALALAYHRRDNPGTFRSDPDGVRQIERQDDGDGLPTERGWAP